MSRTRKEIAEELTGAKAKVYELNETLNSPTWANSKYDPRYIEMQRNYIEGVNKVKKLELELAEAKAQGELGRSRTEIEKGISETQSAIDKYKIMEYNASAYSPQKIMAEAFQKSLKCSLRAEKEELEECIEEERKREEKERAKRQEIEHKRETEERAKRQEMERKREEERVRQEHKREAEEQAKRQAEERIAKQLQELIRRKEEQRENERAEKFKNGNLEFSVDFLREFLKHLINFNGICIKFEPEANNKIKNMTVKIENDRLALSDRFLKDVNLSISAKRQIFNEYKEKLTKSSKEERIKIWDEYKKQSEQIAQHREKQEADNVKLRKESEAKFSVEFKKYKDEVQKTTLANINAEIEKFKNDFNPLEIRKKYDDLQANEPIIESYECKKNNPQDIYIADLSYDITNLKIENDAKNLLNEHYCDLFYSNYLVKVPFCLTFDNRFNYLFETDGPSREMIANRVCSLAMRLLMMIKPGKINFTFIDPITLGATFALFTRIVDDNNTTDDNIINGKIWAATTDIDNRLRVLTERIADVTQRCLQGQYGNIQEYNEKAVQNAEPYRVLVIMDFPAAFKEEQLRMLEQIISTGPKCGVYTIIIKNAEQVAKMDSKLEHLIKNIEAKSMHFAAKNNEIILANDGFEGKSIPFFIKPLPDIKELDKVIVKLKEGVKNAEKIIIPFENSILPDKNEWFKNDCSSELVIPIGIQGANKIQNFVFGHGRHHALIVGQIGSGKSSLLHTIIMSSLVHYSAEQLNIFLIDFKHGVEFKIYADHKLQVFRAVSIESEREFGGSVLDFLDKEQKRRAELFNSCGNNVDNIQTYRENTKKTLPRIVLIIDEFNVMFSKDDSVSKNAAKKLEDLICQSRAFGIHVILAAQTMANVVGVNHGVWGQVGIRIALKCPQADAQFILGVDSEKVKQLSPANPGQAVYNSEGGNSTTASTIFRVAYIDGNYQNELLTEISNSAPKTENMPEPRIMVSNIEDNIYHPFNKFIAGEKIDGSFSFQVGSTYCKYIKKI
ncbi:hypothetical protein AGMMS49938_07660 [Fibrobacterales bacterium]|nr:hypothetical protein AGMMS49938_07660 [Fibrobacterales bacterium]